MKMKGIENVKKIGSALMFGGEMLSIVWCRGRFIGGLGEVLKIGVA